MYKYTEDEEQRALEDDMAATMAAPRMEESYAPAAAGPVMDTDGAFAPDWYSRFDELKEHAPTLSKFRRPEALAKSYAALERMKGYPGVENKRQMGTFRRSVGLPERVEEYHLSRPEDMNEQVWDAALADELGQLAYEYGVPAPAMDALVRRYCQANDDHLKDYHMKQEESIHVAEADLQRSWGLQFEDNMDAVQSVLVNLSDRAGVELGALAQNPALRANPDFARLMLEVAKLVEEPPMREGASMNHKDEAYRIAHDSAHPLHEAYMRTNHPQHRHANEQYDLHAFRRK